MKILITEQQYNIIQELLDSEVAKLHEFGYTIVDRFDLGPYTMLLLHNEEEDIYEVSLTTEDEEFTTYDSQVTKLPTHSSNFLKIGKLMVRKVNEWLSLYGDLTVGSLNKERTFKYHRIFHRLGINVGDVEHTPPDDNFPDSFNFIVYSENI